MHSIRWKILRPILDAGMSFVQKDTGLSWIERSQRTDELEDRPGVAVLRFADNFRRWRHRSAATGDSCAATTF